METESVKQSIFCKLIFPLPSESGEIDTAKFVTVAENLPALFDSLGTWMTLVKADVQGNIKKIHECYIKDPAHRQYLSDLVQSEVNTNTQYKDPCGTIGLVWLSRGLRFLYEFLVVILEDYHSNIVTESLLDAIRRAYNNALLKHHNWFMQKTFHVFAYASPKRSSLIACITFNNSIVLDQVMKELEVFMRSIKPNLDQIDRMLAEKNIVGV